MKDFIDENALAITGLIVIGCWAMAVKIDPGSQNIVSGVIGGLLGYITRSVVKKEG